MCGNISRTLSGSQTLCTTSLSIPYVQLDVGWVMVFNVTFNNISAISWWPVLLVEETGVPGENHRPVASHLQTLFHEPTFIKHNISTGTTNLK
jgi:hypothetical protein